MEERFKQEFSWPLFFSPFVSRLGDALFIFGLNWFIVKATGHASLLGIVQGIGVLFWWPVICLQDQWLINIIAS